MFDMHYRPLNLYSNYEQAAQRFPNTSIHFDQIQPAFRELGLETTYQDSLTLIQTRAYQLAALGIQPGDKVMLFKSPRFETYLLAVAVTYLGAVPAMISYHFDSDTLTALINRLENPFVLYDEVTRPTLESVTADTDYRGITINQLIQQPADAVAQVQIPKHDLAYLTHTSGTTGIPKLIAHSPHTMGWRTLYQRIIFSHLPKEGRVAFHISPVHSRFNIGVSSLMSMGFPFLALDQSDVQAVARQLESYQPVALETHPNHFVQWASQMDTNADAFGSIAYYHSTFDAINNGTMAKFLQYSHHTNPIFLQIYGQSECGPMILKAHTRESLPTDDARNMGVGLAPLTMAKITTPQGDDVPQGADGHILLKSKGRALTYYHEDARFQEQVYGPWWDSGDYGCLNQYGELILKDRQRDRVQTIDSNLALEDLLLDQLDCLSEVVIIAGSDGKPQPILSLAPGAEMDWTAWWNLIADLPFLHEPILMDFDTIPRTATMKVRRVELEEMLKDRDNLS